MFLPTANPDEPEFLVTWLMVNPDNWSIFRPAGGIAFPYQANSKFRPTRIDRA